MPRLAWDAVDEDVRRRVDAALGHPVVSAVDLDGGFSPGAVARLGLADGSTVFAKAVSPAQNPESPGLARHEARVAAGLPAGFPAPRLLHALDDGRWVVLLYEFVPAGNPTLPWEPAQLDRVVAAIAELPVWTAPSPVGGLPAVIDLLATDFGRWALMADRGIPPSPPGMDAIEPALGDQLDRLAAIEAGWRAAAAGEGLVHLDLRSDNLLIDRSDRVWFVDWAHGAVGAPWIDLALLLPSVAMEGGPSPEEVWAGSPYASVDEAAVTAVVAAVAGFFTYGARLPPPPGLPTLRAFQEAQAVHARRWLLARL